MKLMHDGVSKAEERKRGECARMRSTRLFAVWQIEHVFSFIIKVLLNA